MSDPAIGRSAPTLAALFDMDGVLIDSVALNWRAINEVLAVHGAHVGDNQIKQYLGRTLEDQMARLNADFGLQLEYAAFETATGRIRERLFRTLAPKEGVEKLLDSLRSAGVPLAVGTSMPRDLTEDRLRKAGILQFFDQLITEELVERHKPDPETYLSAAKSLGAPPSICVVFEDAPTGVAAAKAANMRCVAVRTPYVPAEELQTADVVLPSLVKATLESLRQLVSA